MKQAADTPTTKSPGNGAFGAGIIALTFLDTTWRIAVPVVAATLAGIYADRHWGTKPWLTLVSVAVGFGVAALLVKEQLAQVQKSEERQ